MGGMPMGGMPMGGMPGGQPMGGCGMPMGGMGGMGGPMGGGCGQPFGGFGGGFGGMGGQQQFAQGPAWGRKAAHPLKETLAVAGGVVMPTRIFGTRTCAAAAPLDAALAAGYRHFDCASQFGNLRVVGRWLESTLEGGGAVARRDLFVTVKIGRAELRDPRAACKAALRHLRLDAVDMLLLHFPAALMPNYDTAPDVLFDLAACWRHCEKLVDDGLARCLGVCNFEIAQLRGLLATARRKPALNQIERHPRLQQGALVEFCRERDVAVAAYNVFHGDAAALGTDFLMTRVAEKCERSAAAVALRWQLATGAAPISFSATRAASNFDLFSFDLDGDDLDAIAMCDDDARDYHAGFLNYNRLPRDETWAGQRGVELCHDHVVFCVAFLLRGPLAVVGNPIAKCLTRCFTAFSRVVDPERTIVPVQDWLWTKLFTFFNRIANEDAS